ncbi:MAG TPA: c-type cytochrome [Bryobacteraceae bacterium]|jgi:mono/diheme cytochrome c family protein|nr:c-type cytochrome [Bryobacteraceae bacterium]
MIRSQFWFTSCAAILLLSCGHPPEHYVLPDQVTDFSALYQANCSGCHGENGRNGAARPLDDPLYLALIGRERLREVVANGVPHTTMPPFSQNAGGTLTEQQISVLADEMQKRWAQKFVDTTLPPYAAKLGDVTQGEAAFRKYCASCHGEDGNGSVGRSGGSAIDAAYLALVSDQSLRTTVIAGRSDQGIPNWRSYVPDRAMSSQEISDVVAWLAAHRTFPGNREKRGTTAQ